MPASRSTSRGCSSSACASTVRNPNDFQLDVERLLFDLEVNDRELGKGWTTASFDVPAFGEAVVPVTIVVPTSDLIQRIIELGTTQRLDYRLKGEAKSTNATLRTVPFEQDGNFALPKIPVIAPPRPKACGLIQEVGSRARSGWSAARRNGDPCGLGRAAARPN